LLHDATNPDRRIEIRRHNMDAKTALAAAQVHATLALAAATALQPASGGDAHRDKVSWYGVAAVPSDDKDDSS
jgi:hypothetical protein